MAKVPGRVRTGRGVAADRHATLRHRSRPPDRTAFQLVKCLKPEDLRETRYQPLPLRPASVRPGWAPLEFGEPQCCAVPVIGCPMLAWQRLARWLTAAQMTWSGEETAPFAVGISAEFAAPRPRSIGPRGWRRPHRPEAQRRSQPHWIGRVALRQKWRRPGRSHPLRPITGTRIARPGPSVAPFIYWGFDRAHSAHLQRLPSSRAGTGWVGWGRHTGHVHGHATSEVGAGCPPRDYRAIDKPATERRWSQSRFC